VIRKLKRALGINFSTKALARNPDIALRQYLGRFWRFDDLAKTLSARQPVTIVQVGANDGSSNDPLGRMIAAHPERIANALLFEPQASAFGRLAERYRDRENIICLNAAVDRQPGEQKVYSVDREAASKAIGQPISDGIASFDRNHVVRVLTDNAPGLTESDVEMLVTEQTVQVTTLGDAAAANGIAAPDILLVDTEGFDAEIMAMALDAGWTPKLLQYEHKHLSTSDRRALSGRLRGLGYRLWADHSDVWGQKG